MKSVVKKENLIKFHQYFLLMILVLLISACNNSDSDSDSDSDSNIARGELVSSSSMGSYNASIINPYTSYYCGVTATNGVQRYKIIYRTVTPQGTQVKASASLLIPDSGANFPIVIFAPGTLLERTKSPSIATTTPSYNSIGSCFATDGYVTVLPDYLGMGEDTTQLHPYHHRDTIASASIDALRAIKSLLTQKSINATNQLFVTGYSEGGFAAMSIHREIQLNYSSEFKVTASAPMAGAYDMSGTIFKRMTDGTPYPQTGLFYWPYLYLAYKAIYGLDQYLQEPYLTDLPPLFDGKTNSTTINAKMPSSNIPIEMFSNETINDMKTNENHPFRQALKKNDTYEWQPTSKMYLIHCKADDQVPYDNAVVAYNYFQNNGASQYVTLTDPKSDGTHETCFIPAMKEVKNKFDALK